MIVCRTTFDTGTLGLRLIRKSTVHHGIFVLRILNFSLKTRPRPSNALTRCESKMVRCAAAFVSVGPCLSRLS